MIVLLKNHFFKMTDKTPDLSFLDNVGVKKTKSRRPTKKALEEQKTAQKAVDEKKDLQMDIALKSLMEEKKPEVKEKPIRKRKAAPSQQPRNVAPPATDSSPPLSDVGRKCKRYIQSQIFGDELKKAGITMASYKRCKTPEEKQELFEEIREVVGGGNGSSFVHNNSLFIIKWVEKTLENTSANCTGLEEVLRNDKDYQRLVEEVFVETGLPYISPKIRLPLYVVATGARLNQINKIKKKMDASSAVPVHNSNIPTSEPQVIRIEKPTIITEPDLVPTRKKIKSS